MVWQPDKPQRPEVEKIRFEVVPYVHGRALDVSAGGAKAFPNMISVGRFPEANVIDFPEKVECFAPELFDCVFSSHCLDKVEDPAAALRRWWELLKVGGYLVLYLHHRDHFPRVGLTGSRFDQKNDFVNEDVIDLMARVGNWDLAENQLRTEGDEYSFLQVYRKRAAGTGNTESWEDPKPEKTAAIVRLGAYGDAIWASSITSHLKEQGYHVTVYTQECGETMLRSDPNTDRIIVVSDYLVQNHELVGYVLGESVKYDRFINLMESVEVQFLPHPASTRFYWPDDRRRDRMNKNYLEEIHDWAGLPHDFRQRFYPTAEERAWAEAERAKYVGPVVCVCPSGSSTPKWWPYTGEFMKLLADRSIHCFAFGAMRQEPANIPETYGHMVGMDWPIRKAMAFAQLADVVVGTETGVLNAVAFESMLKIVFLSHSSPENLTKHWVNTIEVQPTGLDCYPCHRIHAHWHFCTRDRVTMAAACQAVARPEMIAAAVFEYLKPEQAALVPEPQESMDAAHV